MEADYNDVVPRRDFEALDAKFKKLEAKYGHLKTEMKALKQEQKYLFVFLFVVACFFMLLMRFVVQSNSKDTIKQLETKLAELNDEMENARENGTPRFINN
jgi:cell division protein FtsB